MARKKESSAYENIRLPLANELQAKIKQWSNSGYPSVEGKEITHITRELLNYWFNQDGSPFYPCQKEAIETLIYCFEILRNPILLDLYQLLAPQDLIDNIYLKKIEGSSFPKYCLKMATGTGKTWVLALALIWQFFNAMEYPRSFFCSHFLVVAPRLIVYERLLDSFLGKMGTDGKRNRSTSDYDKDYFFPDGWREDFKKIRILTKDDIHVGMSLAKGPFVLITNWHRLNFSNKKTRKNVLEDWYEGFSEVDESIADTIKDLLSSSSDLMVFNDEAHHVHDMKDDSIKIWQESVNIIKDKIQERHKAARLTQVDFSATPFETRQNKRIVFPHIIYEYDIVKAMNTGLVKQIFLESRNQLSIDEIDKFDAYTRSKLVKVNLEKEDIKAVRNKATNEPIDLSLAQKLLIQIGLKKLEQLEEEWEAAKIKKKPVFFIIAEDNKVANLVEKEISKMPNRLGRKYALYDKNDSSIKPEVITIHSDRKGMLPEEEYETIRKLVFNLDDLDNPLKIVISVMMLKEGFDVNSVCVIAGLRALDSYVLAEQTIGRGLRLMFREPEYEEPKNEVFNQLKNGENPGNSFDQLFVVEHPTFREFYKWLEEAGAHIGTGDSTKVPGTGDLITTEVKEERQKFDIAWPETLVTEFKEKTLDTASFDLANIRKYPIPFEKIRDHAKVWLTEKHMITENVARTWTFRTDIFDYNQFLRNITQDLIKDATSVRTNLSNYSSEIMELVDRYCTDYLFGKIVNFAEDENYPVLNIIEVYSFIKQEFRKSLNEFLLSFNTDSVVNATWRKLSVMKYWRMKKNSSIEVRKSIYERLPFGHGAGLEKSFAIGVLEKSPEVKSWSKLNDKRGSFHLHIKYLAEDGNFKSYFPDFLIKTNKKIYLVETKSDRDFEKDPEVRTKAVNTRKMASLFSKIICPFEELDQPKEWEYILIPESRFNDNINLSFEALANVCKDATDRLTAG
jgi:type III restriction enzyme